MTDTEALKSFIDQVRWMYEAEYGDFKRKLGLYLERLEQSSPELAKGRGRAAFAQIKETVVYSPTGDIEATRRRVLEICNTLLQ